MTRHVTISEAGGVSALSREVFAGVDYAVSAVVVATSLVVGALMVFMEPSAR